MLCYSSIVRFKVPPPPYKRIALIIPPMKNSMIARLSVTLAHVEPKVLRRLDIPADLRLDRLHLVLQAAMGWSDSHLYEIRARSIGWGIPDPGWGDGPLDARKANLWDVVHDTGTKTLQYIYDFGDCWEHVIKIERFLPADPGVLYPILFDAAGCCPPEDVGGAFAYREFLAAMADPNHENHAMTREWWDADFDPAVVPFDRLTAAVAALARKWNRKPRRAQL